MEFEFKSMVEIYIYIYIYKKKKEEDKLNSWLEQALDLKHINRFCLYSLLYICMYNYQCWWELISNFQGHVLGCKKQELCPLQGSMDLSWCQPYHSKEVFPWQLFFSPLFLAIKHSPHYFSFGSVFSLVFFLSFYGPPQIVLSWTCDIVYILGDEWGKGQFFLTKLIESWSTLAESSILFQPFSKLN